MCLFKRPKVVTQAPPPPPKPAAPPPPPPPPAQASAAGVATSAEKVKDDAYMQDAMKARRGRKSLRIDLKEGAQATGKTGLNIPRG